MNIIDALLGEHGVLYALFDQAEEEASNARSLKDVTTVAGIVLRTLVSHAHIEDEVLFPAMEKRIGPDASLVAMREEHEEIRRILEGVRKAKQPASAAHVLSSALSLARDHFEKEERVLFGQARKALGCHALKELGDQWADMRRVAVA